MVARFNHVGCIVSMCESAYSHLCRLTPLVEKEQIATKADLELCHVNKARQRSEHHDKKADRLILHSEKALEVGAVAIGVATTVAGLIKAGKAN
jgi:hypothetical protein